MAASVDGIAIQSLKALDVGVENLTHQRVQAEGDLKRYEQQMSMSAEQIEDIEVRII